MAPWILVSLAAVAVVIVALLLGRARRAAAWDPAGIPPPWGDRPSIYAHVKAHLEPGGPGLTAGGEALPDAARFEPGSGLKFAPGALDGILGHHANEQPELRAATVLDAIAEAATAPTSSTLERVYGLVSTEDAVGVIDPLLEALIARKGLDLARIRSFARWLVTQAPDRNAVKVGVALLGVFRGEADRDTFLSIGRHDEFTLFAAVALRNSLPDAELTLFELAKSVRGWGRIQSVERLRDAKRPEVKAWLLREGYQNHIMYEYLAHLCATTGGLKTALEAGEIDDVLLDGAGDLLGALIAGQGGPAEGIDDYADGAAAAASYLRHLRGHIARAPLRHVTVLGLLRDFLGDQKANWDSRATRGWTPEVRRRLEGQVGDLLSEARWRALATEGLSAQDAREFQEAAAAAKDLGIDTWEWQYARVQAGAPGLSWYALCHATNRERMVRAVELAVRQLPLARIGTGPGNEVGIGPGWEPHRDLDFVLQELGAYPGLGWNLIQAGLKSPVIRNRNMALRALAGWGRARWPAPAEAALQEARRQEPDPEVSARIDRVLRGQSLAD